jgi:RNA polymerase sigma factor FliA
LAEHSQKKIRLDNLVDRDELVEKYKYYVYSIVKKIRATLPQNVDFEELVSYGMVGLMESADRFDPRRGIAFTTFSYYRIRGAIFDGLRDMGVLMRSPQGKWVQREANVNDLIQTASDDSDGGHQTVDDEISEVGRLVDRILPAYMLSLSDESTPEVVDANELPSEIVELDDLVKLVRAQVDSLSAKERKLIEKLYFKQVSTTQLAREMGVTKSWVSRLHSKAIAQLRDNLIRIGVIPSD